MENPLVLTIDFGTQSVRVGLVNKQGEIVALERVKYEPAYFSPKPGYAEQDPEFYFKNLCIIFQIIKNFVPHIGHISSKFIKASKPNK